VNTPPPLPVSNTPNRSSKKGLNKALVVIILVVLAFFSFLGYRIYGFIQYVKEMPRVSEPGHTEFRIANKSIIRNDGKVAKGNNTRAEALARDYSEHFAVLRESFFTESDDSAFSLSKGEMLTYCHLREDSCIFLVHVPQLRNFTGDAKSSIVDLAWHCANTVLKGNKVPGDMQLALGVKGLMSYEAILIGKLDVDGEPLSGLDIRESGIASQKLFYPFFAPIIEDKKAEPQR